MIIRNGLEIGSSLLLATKTFVAKPSLDGRIKYSLGGFIKALARGWRPTIHRRSSKTFVAKLVAKILRGPFLWRNISVTFPSLKGFSDGVAMQTFVADARFSSSEIWSDE